jgi:type I restriction enzyme S subunit
MRWQERTLGEICDEEGGTIQTGPFGSQLHQTDYQEEGVPVVMPQDIVDGRVNLNSVAKVSEEIANRLARHKLKVGAIVMPRRGEVNKRAFVTETERGYLCGTGCVKIELEGKVLEPRFLYYYLEQPQIVGWIEHHAVGTTMLNLNTTIVREVPIRYPQLEEQRRIASILSAYDNLIENNLRRMVLLEESVRLLYREWFVRLCFPGYEHTRIVNGVPGGWERKQLGDVLTLNYGKALKESDRLEGPFPVYGSSGVVGTHNEALVKGPGIIVGRKGNVGSVYWAESDFWPIDTVYFVESRQSNYFLFHNLQHQNFLNSDGAVPGLNRNYAYSLPILLPKQMIREEFEQTVAPIYEQMSKLRTMNQKLKTARDLLLPRLMRGEIAV